MKRYLTEFPIYGLQGAGSYASAALPYRRCGKSGTTLRGVIDCPITRIAIENGLVILHKDRASSG